MVLVPVRLIRRGGLALTAVLALAVSGAATPADGGAEARVTLSARPTVLGWAQSATLFGAVDNDQAGERVTIEVRDCPLTSFREVATAETSAGGTWTLSFGAGVNTTVRAVWKGATSVPVALRQVPRLQLDRRSARKFEVGVANKGQMWRKKVLFQRRSRGSWITVKTVTLSDTAGQAGQAFVWTSVEFRASVPRRSVVRAVLPVSQARPCYLGAVSNTVRA